MAMAAPPVKVYGPPLSTAVSRVLACLLEKDVAFHLVPVNMAKGEHKKTDYLNIQPFGQVPAFQDETISLFESRAICRYVSEKFSNQGNRGLYGLNLVEKASIDQWVEAEAQSFNPPSSVLVFQLAFAPMMKIEQDQGAIKQNEQKLAKVLDIYETRLGETRFLAGEEFTLADLSHLPNVQYLLMRTDRGEMFTSRKNVWRWWEEVSARDSWKKVVDMQNAPPPAAT
ncbi:glutathione S-transferase PARB-like [Impatiens glandulifera]|uniref:glutathione S-transferase PARB-like n=1 Tax=Impatiens glandulifera TaxID=253017 RepID=UPI001FB0E5A7|nr:glutathione S-transferase PARB-like [Impatiens glandulifera]